jgi:hypothetical protein
MYKLVIKRENDISYKRASDILSFFVSFLILAFCLKLLVVFEIIIQLQGWIVLGLLLLLFWGNMYIHSWLFYRKDQHLEIIKYFDQKRINKSLMKIVAVLLLIGSFVAFAVSGIGYDLFVNN